MKKTEKDEKVCILFGINSSKIGYQSDSNSLDELALLAETAGFFPKEKILYKRDRIDPAYFIGRGKAHELRKIIVQNSAEAAIFDFELSAEDIKDISLLLNRV